MKKQTPSLKQGLGKQKMNNKLFQNNNQSYSTMGIDPARSSREEPNNTLRGVSMTEEVQGRNIEFELVPSRFLELEIFLNYKFRGPEIKTVKSKDFTKSLEDLIYFLDSNGLFDESPSIYFGTGEVEERSGPESSIDSYYYQGNSNVDVMTIEGEAITKESINRTAENLIKELENKNLL